MIYGHVDPVFETNNKHGRFLQVQATRSSRLALIPYFLLELNKSNPFKLFWGINNNNSI
jgi:hypothetical protein